MSTQHAPVTGTSTYAQKSWGGHPRCDLAPLTTSFGTVGQWERQHLAMAGSEHLHLPRNATAHRAARANSHVPRWRSGLAVPASCWSPWIPEGFRRMFSSAAVFLAYRRSRLFADVFTRAFQRDRANYEDSAHLRLHERPPRWYGQLARCPRSFRLYKGKLWYFFTGSSPSFLSGSRRL